MCTKYLAQLNLLKLRGKKRKVQILTIQYVSGMKIIAGGSSHFRETLHNDFRHVHVHVTTSDVYLRILYDKDAIMIYLVDFTPLI